MKQHQNMAIALSMAKHLTDVAHKAMEQGRDVKDEELDAATNHINHAPDLEEDSTEEEQPGRAVDDFFYNLEEKRSDDAPVTALCPTYGRFESLRDVVACFLLQTYRPRQLLVLNDAPKPLSLHGRRNTIQLRGATVEVWNVDSRYETLGHKRQALLTAARTDLVAHWDDDDWYLPWHLSQCVEALQGNEAACVQPSGAWYCTGQRDSLQVKGPRHNVFEGQMAFDRRVARDLGGYSQKDSGQARDLMERFKEHNSFCKWEPEKLSYCYRWGDGWTHISAAKSGARFADGNANFGNNPVIPENVDPASWAQDRMKTPWSQLLEKKNNE